MGRAFSVAGSQQAGKIASGVDAERINRRGVADEPLSESEKGAGVPSSGLPDEFTLAPDELVLSRSGVLGGVVGAASISAAVLLVSCSAAVLITDVLWVLIAATMTVTAEKRFRVRSIVFDYGADQQRTRFNILVVLIPRKKSQEVSFDDILLIVSFQRRIDFELRQ